MTSLLLMLSLVTFGQATWEKTKTNTDDDVIATRLPTAYQLYDIDLASIQVTLEDAPERFTTSFKDSPIILRVPNRTGEMQRFKILEAPMMVAELAARFPTIKTYIGQGMDDPTAILNLSIGTDGLHIMVRAAGQSPFFVDPYTRDRNKYITYAKADQPRLEGFTCKVVDEAPLSDYPNVDAAEKNIIDGKMRTYNLAVATTIEYSAYHIANQNVPASSTTEVKRTAVLSAIITTMNRVKGIYETEVSATFVLNANQETIIFIDSDNFNNSDANLLIEESQVEIDAAIGNANYDIGHTFSTGGGGVASLGGICTVDGFGTTSRKAQAITGSTNPIGDSYDVDFVAHEIGHHFGANHSYNGDGVGNCTTSSTSTAAEPGSGTTIMAYAGICGSLNVESNSDAYFHIVSIKNINDRYTNSGNFAHPFYSQCSTDTNTGNQEPIADAGTDYTIPNGTAFVLTGTATDADGDAITYCWDQLDLEQPNIYPLVSTTTTGPLYRSFSPTTSPSRYMPKFETVYNGAVQSTWEVTPTVARNLNFNLTARDNRADGGQSTSADMLVTVAGVGPFSVSSQTATETWATGETKTITWNVAGTTGNGINTANVEIALVDISGAVLSTLIASTPNDGSHDITVPSIVSDDVRIKVTAIGNIFYAVNSALISVNTTPGYCTTTCTSTGGDIDGTTLVSFGTINNTSLGAPAYTDNTSISTDVVRGQSYNLTVNVDTGGPYPEVTRVWIDWNRDCNFDDASEGYDLGTASNTSDGPTSNSPLSIMIPANAELGDTRMRVSTAYSTAKTPCQTSFPGEVEDYSLKIVSVLPVDLTHFRASVKEAKAIQLDWHTMVEINNAGFEIERSMDGDEFQSIAWVNGNGTTSEQNSYQYTDEAVKMNQAYYYRLKQVDNDGAFSYSNIQTAIINHKDTDILLYPNPASEMVNLSIKESLLLDNDLVFYLINALGQEVAILPIQQSETPISVQNMTAGVYFYKVISGQQTIKSDMFIVE